MRSLAWDLKIPYDWCPSKRSRTQTHRDVRTRGDGHLQAKDRGLRRNQPCWQVTCQPLRLRSCLQGGEKRHLDCRSLPADGTLLWRPEQRNAVVLCRRTRQPCSGCGCDRNSDPSREYLLRSHGGARYYSCSTNKRAVWQSGSLAPIVNGCGWGVRAKSSFWIWRPGSFSRLFWMFLVLELLVSTLLLWTGVIILISCKTKHRILIYDLYILRSEILSHLVRKSQCKYLAYK